MMHKLSFDSTQDRIDAFWTVFGKTSPSEQGGFSVNSDNAILLHCCPLEQAWPTATVNVAFRPQGGELHIDLAPWFVSYFPQDSRIQLCTNCFGNTIAAWDIDATADKVVNVSVTCGPSGVDICIDGQEYRYKSSHATRMTGTRIHVSRDVQVDSLFFEATVSDDIAGQAIGRQRHKPALEMTVDFGDDLIPTPFTRSMLDDAMQRLKNLGFHQVNWVYHGRRDSGFWDYFGNRSHGENIQATFDNLGDSLLAAGVEAAHAAGLKLSAVLKPYDAAICGLTLPFDSPDAQNLPQGKVLGGVPMRALRFPVEHPELCMQHKPTPATDGNVAKITITSRKPIAGDVAQCIEVWTSDDNSTYTRLPAESFQTTIDNKQLMISSLDIASPYLAVCLTNNNKQRTILNTLDTLCTLTDNQGNELVFTYSVSPRKSIERKDGDHLAHADRVLDFSSAGFDFDCAKLGIPSAVFCGSKVQLELFALDGEYGVIGLARGKNQAVPGCLSMAEADSRAFWLDMIQQCLAAGVDGVDIRVQNHGDVLLWEDYGFNQPIVDTYKERYGIDIRSQEYSKQHLREIRGEFHTQFLQEASECVRGANAIFRLHIEDTMERGSDESTQMEIFWNWREWLEQGLADEVTFKALNVRSHQSAFGRDLIATCREKGIRIVYCPFVHSLMADFQTDKLQEELHDAAFDALDIYEHATMFLYTPEGKVRTVNERLLSYIESW